MRRILYVLIFLALLVLAGFLFPRVATTERSVYINEPPDVVFPYVNNFRNFNKWSPWFNIDPQTKYTYDGFAEGVGSTMRWHSDDPKVGSGSQAITASEPYSRVAMALDFGAQGKAESEFKLVPQGSGTNVTWSFSSDMGGGPIARWMGLMVSKMVGNSFQEGLQKLKQVVEKESSELPDTEPAQTPETHSPGQSDPGTIEPDLVDPDMESQIIDEDDTESMDDDGDALEDFQPEAKPQ